MRGSGQAHAQSKQLSFIFTNIRSVIPKRDDINSVIDSCDADIVILTESWLSSKVSSCEIFNCSRSLMFIVGTEDRGVAEVF